MLVISSDPILSLLASTFQSLLYARSATWRSNASLGICCAKDNSLSGLCKKIIHLPYVIKLMHTRFFKADLLFRLRLDSRKHFRGMQQHVTNILLVHPILQNIELKIYKCKYVLKYSAHPKLSMYFRSSKQ